MRDTTNAFDLTLLQHSSSESSDQSPYRLHSQTMQNNQDKAIDAPASSSESQSMVQANDDTTEKKGRATASAEKVKPVRIGAPRTAVILPLT